MSDDDVHSLSGLYALDALDPPDRLRFEAHLRDCPACIQEVAELQATSARLGTLAAETPPPGLRGKVLAEVAVTRQERPATAPAAPARQRWLPRVATGAVAAVVVLVLGLLAWRVAATSTELDRADALNAVLTAPDARNLQMTGTDGISGRVVESNALDRTVVVLDGLAPVPDDQRYALWLIDADGPKPMGLVRPDSHQRAVTVLDTGLDGFQGFGLTIEPASGSPTPTGPLLMQGALT